MIIVIGLSTILLFCWFALLFSANEQDHVAAAKGQLLSNRQEIEALRKKQAENKAKLENYHGLAKTAMSLLFPVKDPKEIEAIKKKNRQIQSGNFKSVNMLNLPGYVLLRKFPKICESGFYRKIHMCYYELYGKKHQELLTRQMMAKRPRFPVTADIFSSLWRISTIS